MYVFETKRHETDDFALKKITDCEGKISFFQEITKKKFQQTPIQKMSENFFAYSCVSEHAKHFNLFPTKTCIFLAHHGFPLPLPP